jgi:hypothetical protein
MLQTHHVLVFYTVTTLVKIFYYPLNHNWILDQVEIALKF